jgi:hypothetical protein
VLTGCNVCGGALERLVGGKEEDSTPAWDVLPPSAALGCRLCDWDVCLSCFKQKVPPEDLQERPPRSQPLLADCPQHHGLLPFLKTGEHTRYLCDWCEARKNRRRREWEEGTTSRDPDPISRAPEGLDEKLMFGCALCDFDLCERCACWTLAS